MMISRRALTPLLVAVIVVSACAPAAAPAAPTTAAQPAAPAAAAPTASKPAAAPTTAAAPQPTAAPKTLKKLQLAYSTLSPIDVNEWVAFETGQWPKYGIDMEIIFQEGSNTLTQALVSGSLKYGANSGPPTVAARAAGADLVLLSTNAERVTDILVAQPEIKSAADLKGKRVAISTFGSEGDLTMVRALQTLGLDPDKDVTRLQIGQESARLAALRAKTVSAGMLEPAQEPDARALGLNVLTRLKDLNLNFQKNGLTVSRAYLGQNREEVTNVLKGIVSSIRFMKDPANEARVKEIIAKYMKGSSQGTIDATYTDAVTLINRKPLPTVAGVQSIIDQLAQQDPSIKEKVKATDVVDTSILDELDRSGFIADLYKDCPNCLP